MSDDDRLRGPAADRLEVALGAIGDDAAPPRPFDEIDTAPISPTPTSSPKRPWVVVAAGVAVIALVVAVGTWWSGAGDDDVASDTSAPVTSPETVTTLPTSSTTTITSPAVAGLPFRDAAVAPSLVPPGGLFSVTPSGVIDRTCADVVPVFQDVGGSLEQVAQASPVGHDWQLSDDVVPYTMPGCLQGPSNAAATYQVPTELAPGMYVICLSGGPTAAGCGTFTVSDAAEPTPSTAPATSGLSLNDVFVTVSGEQRALIDVRDAAGVVASFDLGCPADRDCMVQSARVMDDTIWVAINDSELGAPDNVAGSRIVSVTGSTGEVVEHLALDGTASVRSAGRGANGVLYAYIDNPVQPSERRLVAVDDGEAHVLKTGVSGFRLSDDGRFLAVSFSNPPAGEQPRFEITDLVNGTTATFVTDGVDAGAAAWSPDGRYLIVDEQWEDGAAWVVDPLSGSGEPVAGTDRFLDGACFMGNDIVAHRTWNVGYGQGDAQPGVIRLTSISDGSTVADIGDHLFGDAFRCHPDGTVTYLRRPVIEVQLTPDFAQLQPDDDAPVELVHLTEEGEATIDAASDLRMV